MSKNQETLTTGNIRKWSWNVGAGAAMLLAAGCGNGASEQAADTPSPLVPSASATSGETTAEPVESAAPSASASVGRKVVDVAFFVHGGTISQVNVFSGPGTDASDKVRTGAYVADKDVVPADCKVTNGRGVSTVKADGEAPFTSNDWVHLAVTYGEPQFATATYLKNPDKILGELDECPPEIYSPQK